MTNSYYTAINAIRGNQIAAMFASDASASAAVGNTESTVLTAGDSVDFQALLLESFSRGGAAAMERTKNSAADISRFGAERGIEGNRTQASSLAESLEKAAVRKAAMTKRVTREGSNAYKSEAYHDVYSRDLAKERAEYIREQALVERDRNRREFGADDATLDRNEYGFLREAIANEDYGEAVTSDAVDSADRRNGRYGEVFGWGSSEMGSSEKLAALNKILASVGLEGEGETLLSYLRSLNGVKGSDDEASAGLFGGGQDVTSETEAVLLESITALLTKNSLLATENGGVATVDTQGVSGERTADDQVLAFASTDINETTVEELLKKISEFTDTGVITQETRRDIKSIISALMANADSKSRELTAQAESADGAGDVSAAYDNFLDEATGTDGVLKAESQRKTEDGKTKSSAPVSADGDASANGTRDGAAQVYGAAVVSAARVGDFVTGKAFGVSYATGAISQASAVKGVGDGTGSGNAGENMNQNQNAGAFAKEMTTTTVEKSGDAGTTDKLNTEVSDTIKSYQDDRAGAVKTPGFGRGGAAGARSLTSAMLPEFFGSLSKEAKLVQSGEKSEIVMSLSPESLGKMTMKVVTEQGVVNAKLVVENEQAKQSLENNIAQLKETLAEQGLSVESCMVEVRQGGDQSALYNEFDGGSDAGNQRGGINNNGAGLLVDDANGIIDAGRRAFLRDRYFEQESRVRYLA